MAKKLLVASLFISSLVTASANAKELLIELATAQRDPLVEVVSPPASSPDRVSFTQEGMLISQHADVPNTPTSVAGFKMLLAASGDFKAALHFRIDELQAPSEGWGQGLIFTLHFNDVDQTQLKLNQVAFNGAEGLNTSIDRFTKSAPQEFQIFADSIRDGSMIIERVGDEAIFSLNDKNGLREVARLPCPSANLRGIDVWSTRQGSGNTSAKILLKRLTIEAGSFTASADAPISFWTSQRLFIAANVVMVIVLGVAAIRRRYPGVRRVLMSLAS